MCTLKEPPAAAYCKLKWNIPRNKLKTFVENHQNYVKLQYSFKVREGIPTKSGDLVSNVN